MFSACSARFAFIVVIVCGAVAAVLHAQGKPQTFKGLQMTVTAVERADKASLKDCPPGTNTVNAVARTGEQYSLVTVAFKVPSGFQSAPMKRASVVAADGKTYNTSVQFVDVGSVPEYSCTFPFRVPEGTKLKSLQIETASFDLAVLESK
jgi:hypothetical protein